MRYRAIVVLLGRGLAASVAFATPAETPGLAFHASYDDTVVAVSGAEPLEVHGEVAYVKAPTGKGVSLSEGSWLAYPAAGHLDKSAGSLLFWVQPQWHGGDGKRHTLFSDSAPTHNPAFNSFHLFKTPSATLEFVVGGLAEQSVSTSVADWTAGEWHHVAVTWDCRQGIALYVDGQEAGTRQLLYEPQQWPAVHVGADYDGSVTASAALAELMLFDRQLRTDQVQALAARLPLPIAETIETAAPTPVRAGQTIPAQTRALATEPRDQPHALLLSLGGVPIARVMPQPQAQTWPEEQAVELDPVSVQIPDYLPLMTGQYGLQAVVEGTMSTLRDDPPAAPVALAAASRMSPSTTIELRDGELFSGGEPWLAEESGLGFVHEGRFYPADEAGRATAVRLYQRGQIREALRCVSVAEATREAVQEDGSYLLKTDVDGDDDSGSARLLVVEMDTDVAPSGVSLQVRSASEEEEGRPADRLLVWATLKPGSDRRMQEQFLFYPTGDACQVRLSRLGETEAGQAVTARRIAVYRLVDYPSQNVIGLPEGGLRRTLALMPVHAEQIYDSFGVGGRERMQRQLSLRRMLDYMQFLGFDRLVLHAGGSMYSYYDGGMLPNAWRWDLLEDLLPLAEAADVQVVPVVPPLSSFDRLFSFSADSFLLDIHGETVRDRSGNRCPNPLRPEVQKQMMVFLDELCTRTADYSCVPALGITVDGATGTCMVSAGGEQTADRVGYSEWDLDQFQAASGLALDTRGGGPIAAYYLLQNSPEHWQQWLEFRCRQSHDLCTKCRDLVVSRNPRRTLYVDSRLPVPVAGAEVAEGELLRCHGYDSEMFATERGIHLAAWLGGEYGSEVRSGFATGEGTVIQLEAGDMATGRDMLLPLLHAIISDNPYWLTVRSSLDAKVGREPALREFARAYRALPATPGQPFEGEVAPAREDIWVRVFGDSLAVINLGDKPQTVRLEFRRPLPFDMYLLDQCSGQKIRFTRVGGDRLQARVPTQAYEMRTLKIVEPMPQRGPGVGLRSSGG